jgi:pimeloyl-ACP methyl ester carboxylesterase
MLLCIAVACLISCANIPKNGFDGLVAHRINGNGVYEIPSEGSKRLLIYIEGSGTTSVLGEIKNEKWVSVNFGYFVVKQLSPSYTVIIPEKLGIGIGENHWNDPKFLRKYTVDNLVSGYARSIDGYLDAHRDYESVFVIAGSEGGLLFPKILSELNNKDRIRKAVVIGAGGLSQFECFKILARSSVEMPEKYREECGKIEEVYSDVQRNRDSLDMVYLGWPYARWSSFLDYRPFDYYASVDIPVLFYQGVEDWSSPVESVEYIQKNLRNEEFEYAYIEGMGHVPDLSDESSVSEYFSVVRRWLDK